jgi:hypothetical protein
VTGRKFDALRSSVDALPATDYEGALRDTNHSMKLLAWNRQHGGGARLARIVEELAAYEFR